MPKFEDIYNIEFFNPDTRLGKTCPECGSKEIAFLLYGIGCNDDEEELVDRREIILRGCIFDDDAPNLGCRDCEHTWQSVSPMK